MSRRPYQQMSPFARRLEPGLGYGKIQRDARQTAEHVQGCGDPNCDICMPKNWRPGGSKTGGGGGDMGDGIKIETIIIDGMLREIGRSGVFGDRVNEWRTVGFDPAASKTPDPLAEARRRERALRGKVEKYFLSTKHGIDWDDVVGNGTARRAMQEAIEHPVKHKDVYAFYGMKPTKGVLLHGAPGCGKTMFGKAAASVLAQLHGKADVEHTLLSIKGPEIQSPYVGVTEEIIRDIFAYARAFKALHGFPLVVFIDEADAIIPSRDGNGSGRRAMPWEESNVATFLTEMDGLDDSGAFVILATNRPEAIDAAVLRDGRCDRKIKVERPDQESVAKIALNALKDAPLGFRLFPQTMADHLAAKVFDHDYRLFTIRHQGGPSFLRLGDIVNGAMVVGLVERAKTNAFQRDIASGGSPSGMSLQDIDDAVLAVFTENLGMNHSYALREFVETHRIAEAVVETFDYRAMPIDALRH